MEGAGFGGNLTSHLHALCRAELCTRSSENLMKREAEEQSDKAEQHDLLLSENEHSVCLCALRHPPQAGGRAQKGSRCPRRETVPAGCAHGG